MSEVKPRTLEVCKICFNASSQKANPTLTQENKMIESNNKKWCPSCKQGWTSLTVAQDVDTNRWASIRPRPLKINPSIDYLMCNSVLKRQSCNKGQQMCTFAHSKVELIMWNLDRWREPRLTPIASQFQLCKYVMSTGGCHFGQRCTFAHSEEELDYWVKRNGDRSFDPRGMAVSKFYCSVCDVQCISQRQLEDHLVGQKHRLLAPPRDPHSNHMVIPLGVRPRPPRLPVNGFRICLNILNHRRCYYGDTCTFAHSEAELEVWNEERLSLR